MAHNYLGELEDLLNAAFPSGAKGFSLLALEETQLHSEKNFDYAGPGNDPLGNFHRVGKLLSLYPLLSTPGKESVKWCVLMMLKQLDAVLTMLSYGYEGKVEGLESRLKDISVYAKIAILLSREYNNSTLVEGDQVDDN